MKEPLVDIIQSIYLLPPQVLEDVLGHFQHLEYPKNYFLLKPTKPSKSWRNRHKRNHLTQYPPAIAKPNVCSRTRPQPHFEPYYILTNFARAKDPLHGEYLEIMGNRIATVRFQTN